MTVTEICIRQICKNGGLALVPTATLAELPALAAQEMQLSVTTTTSSVHIVNAAVNFCAGAIAGVVEALGKVLSIYQNGIIKGTKLINAAICRKLLRTILASESMFRNVDFLTSKLTSNAEINLKFNLKNAVI